MSRSRGFRKTPHGAHGSAARKGLQEFTIGETTTSVLLPPCTFSGRTRLSAWPAGFPIVPSKVRPLARGASKTIAEALGWTIPYTRGVRLPWKSRTAYCNAVLRYRERINPDGLVSGEEVDDRAGGRRRPRPPR